MRTSILPRGWVEQPLEDFAIIERDIIAPECIETGTKYVGLEHITGEGSLEAAQTVKSGQLASAKFRFGPDHLLYGKLRPYLRKIARPSFDGICSTDIVPLMPRNGKASRNYLFHYLRTDKMIELATSRSAGANLPRLSPRLLAGFPVVAPRNVDEQERIAAILDKVDEIRRKRRQTLAEIDALLRATFLDMFGDPATNPKGFDVEPVQRVLSRDRAGTQSGPFGAALKKNELVAQGIPVWGIENVEHNSFNPTMRLFITAKKFAELERYDVRDGDVLISRAGTVGRMCIARPPVARSVLSTNLVRVSLDHSKMIPEYFVTLFTSFPDRLSRLRANKKDNAFSFLNPGTLKVLDIPQPDINLQVEFAKRVKAFAKIKKLRTQAIEQADDLFGALSQRAFRGEL